MKTRRTLVALIFIVITCIGLAFHTGFGTFSQYGIDFISTLCPLGGIEALLASHSILPFGVLGIVIVVVLILIFGRAFCSWACPTMLVHRIFGLKSPYERRLKAKKKLALSDEAEETTEEADASAETVLKKSEAAEAASDMSGADAFDTEAATAGNAAGVAYAKAGEQADSVAYAKAGEQADSAAYAKVETCTTEAANDPDEDTDENTRFPRDDAPSPRRGGVQDSRMWVLVGMLIATLIFGFPVFCLICPVGLSFATVITVWRAIQFGEVTWSLLIFPVILILELVIFRRWCHTLCPLGALVSLISRGNRTFRATLDHSTCLKEGHGIACDRCVDVCPEGIDMHIGELSTPRQECIKCGECSQVCPVHAITFPFLPKKNDNGNRKNLKEYAHDDEEKKAKETYEKLEV